jgi:DNA-binding NtrC family response regulator
MNPQSHRIAIRHSQPEPTLWIVDTEQWPRACLRAELIERGYDAYGFITIGDALESLCEGTSPRPKALVLELRGQDLTPEAIDKIRNLGIPVILLGGNSELNEPMIVQHQWDTILRRPFSLGMVADIVQNTVKRR